MRIWAYYLFLPPRKVLQSHARFSPHTQALRLVLPDTSLSDEDLEVLFMKIDANNSGGVDWDEFTSFLLQA